MPKAAKAWGLKGRGKGAQERVEQGITQRHPTTVTPPLRPARREPATRGLLLGREHACGEAGGDPAAALRPQHLARRAQHAKSVCSTVAADDLPDLTANGIPAGSFRFPTFKDATDAYQRWLPLINYENRQGGILTAKALMKQGGVIACEAGRHPFPPMHPEVRAGLIETARRLDPLVLRWGK